MNPVHHILHKQHPAGDYPKRTLIFKWSFAKGYLLPLFEAQHIIVSAQQWRTQLDSFIWDLKTITNIKTVVCFNNVFTTWQHKSSSVHLGKTALHFINLNPTVLSREPAAPSFASHDVDTTDQLPSLKFKYSPWK